MKKGELFSQPLMYIFTLIASAFVIYFGFTSVSSVQREAKLVELSRFTNDLNEAVDTYYNLDIGSSKKLSLNVPSNVEEVCFVKIGMPVNRNVDQYFMELLSDNSQYNLFTLPLDALPAPAPDFKINNLEIDGNENPLCIATKGKLNAIIETKVRNNNVYVEIRR